MEILPDSSVPAYVQIKEHLLHQIRTGAYPVGSRLPSEREVARACRVSRMTARQALEALRQSGLAYSRSGKGTYVRQPKIDRHLLFLTSFTQEMQQRGLVASSRILSTHVQPADEELANLLQIPLGSELAILGRVRLANGNPLSIETAHIVHEMCPGILAKHDFSRESLYRVLREEYGCVLAWARQTIDARLPLPEEAKLLKIGPTLPVLSMSRSTFTQHDKPIEFVRSVYRSDQYQLNVLLRLSE